MKEDHTGSTAIISYEDPPVNEVVCGLIFKGIAALKIPHIGLLWQRFRDDFPTCEHAEPLEVSEDNVDLVTGLPWPRVWLIGKQENDLIQVQRDRIYYNWRKIGQADNYPRYKHIVNNFKKVLGVFKDFIHELGLGPVTVNRCELTYINHIPRGQGWGAIADLGKVFPEFQWQQEEKTFLPSPSTVSCQLMFRLPEDKGQLMASLRYATRKIDQLPIFVLEISARGLGPDKSMDAVWSWYKVAHEWIVRGFADLTTAEVQENVWKRVSSEH
jgi:uncharacterized protein (TIGR04255 family)